MAKTYRVWVEIEVYDEESGDGKTVDTPGSAVVTFKDHETAQQFAEQLNACGTRLADHFPEEKKHGLVGNT
jgi:hypothetical protein